VGKTIAICVKCLLDIACQNLLKSTNVSRSYSKKIKVAFLLPTVYIVTAVIIIIIVINIITIIGLFVQQETADMS